MKLISQDLWNTTVPVATVLTVYGIETSCGIETEVKPSKVATVLTVYGIETVYDFVIRHRVDVVATVLTVYGIETACIDS